MGVTEGLDALGRRLQTEVDAEEIQNETLLSDAWVQDWTGDDFGTGYSSLAHLRRFPVDALEIDRAFTSEIHEPEGRAIVRTIIGLGRILDLRVIAEGVETTEQADFLRREGCHALQGYWIGRPMKSRPGCGPGLEDRLRGWRRSSQLRKDAHSARPSPS